MDSNMQANEKRKIMSCFSPVSMKKRPSERAGERGGKGG